MHTTQFIRHGLEFSGSTLLTFVEDMRDAPLTFPTPNGGNHPLWVLGHLAVAECMLIQTFALGRSNPLAHWMPFFGPNTTPTADPSAYPSLDEVIGAFKTTRAATLAALDSMSDADLDRPGKAVPPEMAQFFGNVGMCFVHTIYHSCIHTGQVTDARRAAGREPLLFRPPNPAAKELLASVA